MIIRHAYTDDLIKMNTIMIEGINSTVEFSYGDINKIDTWESNIEFLSKSIQDDKYVILVAEINQEIAGVLVSYILPIPEVPFFTKKNKLYIESIDVKDSFRRKKVATFLMNEVNNIAKEKKCKSIELEVYNKNEDALYLYNKLGYETMKQRLCKDI